MKITTAAATSPAPAHARKPEIAVESTSGDVYERRADQRQQLSRKEIMEYLQSRGMKF